ncbi:hypothetical protein MAR_024718 [Mya arenaria]|uniref:Uncharacterized protein n=1 Tax=Mya arenaria TaxID=6604 RepID=A0ABY7DVK8_MYAAR|nr:hypothetical protein MAR_024718 [Mya arenaria]
MQIGAAQFEQVYNPTEEDKDEMTIDIYATEVEDVEFVDEPGCVNIGSFTIPLAGSGTVREVTVRMIFGGTEIDGGGHRGGLTPRCRLPVIDDNALNAEENH